MTEADLSPSQVASTPPSLSASETLSLFRQFDGPSWNRWREILALVGPDLLEVILLAGRGTAKTLVGGAVLSIYRAIQPYPLMPGENIYCGLFAPDQRQSKLAFSYIVGLMRSVGVLNALIVRETAHSLTLVNGVVIEVLPANRAAIRGRTYCSIFLDECAFLRDEQSANPDIEIVRAARPALARCPGGPGLLIAASTPYRRKGFLYDEWKTYGDNHDARVLVLRETTATLNPLFDPFSLQRALDTDAASARSEYLAEWRDDVDDFVSLELIEDVTMFGRTELPYQYNTKYFAFVDMSGGTRGGDSAALAVAHCERRGNQKIAVLDAIREAQPPFRPSDVCREFAALLQAYGIRQVVADRWGSGFVVEALAQHRIRVEQSAEAKSQIYASVLPQLSSGLCQLLDHAKLRKQLQGLERRVGRGGRDVIDHAVGQHDDVANAVCGALVAAVRRPTSFPAGAL